MTTTTEHIEIGARTGSGIVALRHSGPVVEFVQSHVRGRIHLLGERLSAAPQR